MNWMNELGGILQQYTGAGAAQAPDTVHDDFDQTAQTAPTGVLADGLAAAFRSDQTPEFGQMVAGLFGQSSGPQRAGILNTLISTLGPTIAAQLFARKGLSGLAGILGGGQTEVTPQQAEQVPPEAVADIAAQAEKHDPSIIDMVSNFYAEHPTLVKTLGGAALAIALSRIVGSQSR
ncbi:MAG TPA: hypothetical protein VJZ26_02395 [Blastocatellia bacterium]|nr:hypothetical protein [Blastocatellia bacterium]